MKRDPTPHSPADAQSRPALANITRRRLITSAAAIASVTPVMGAQVNVIAGLVTGISGPGTLVEQKAMRLLGEAVSQRISWMPWARAQLSAERGNSIIFPLSRNTAREGMWTWLAPLAEGELVLALRDATPLSLIDLRSRSDLLVGVIRCDVILAHLASLGFTNIEVAPSEASNAKKLELGRIEAWATFRSAVSAAAIESSARPPGHVLSLRAKPIQMWLAATLDLALPNAELTSALSKRISNDAQR